MSSSGKARSIGESMTYITKDSGERIDYDSGMRRDTDKGKPRYDLCYQPLFTRWAELMARGAEKYGERNWEKANSPEEYNRFKASAYRHFIQWFQGENDEDHAAAVLFNIGAALYVESKIEEKLSDNVGKNSELGQRTIDTMVRHK